MTKLRGMYPPCQSCLATAHPSFYVMLGRKGPMLSCCNGHGAPSYSLPSSWSSVIPGLNFGWVFAPIHRVIIVQYWIWSNRQRPCSMITWEEYVCLCDPCQRHCIFFSLPPGKISLIHQKTLLLFLPFGESIIWHFKNPNYFQTICQVLLLKFVFPDKYLTLEKMQKKKRQSNFLFQLKLQSLAV